VSPDLAGATVRIPVTPRHASIIHGGDYNPMHSSEQFSMNCSVVFADSCRPRPHETHTDPSTGVPLTEQIVLGVKAWISSREARPAPACLRSARWPPSTASAVFR
jgi:hypothetical protein